MTNEKLSQRLKELDEAILNTSNSIYVLQGHKQEVMYQLAQLCESQQEAIDNQAESAVL